MWRSIDPIRSNLGKRIEMGRSMVCIVDLPLRGRRRIRGWLAGLLGGGARPHPRPRKNLVSTAVAWATVLVQRRRPQLGSAGGKRYPYPSIEAHLPARDPVARLFYSAVRRLIRSRRRLPTAWGPARHVPRSLWSMDGRLPRGFSAGKRTPFLVQSTRVDALTAKTDLPLPPFPFPSFLLNSYRSLP
jgi:hypothetical protein